MFAKVYFKLSRHGHIVAVITNIDLLQEYFQSIHFKTLFEES